MVGGGFVSDNVAEQWVLAGSDLVSDVDVLLLACSRGGSVEHGQVRNLGNIGCWYCHDASKASGVEVVQSGGLGFAQCGCAGAVNQCASNFDSIDVESPAYLELLVIPYILAFVELS